jgi:adenylosuccinate lyase
MQPEKYVGRAPRQVEKYLAQVIAPILEENKDILGVKADITV